MYAADVAPDSNDAEASSRAPSVLTSDGELELSALNREFMLNALCDLYGDARLLLLNFSSRGPAGLKLLYTHLQQPTTAESKRMKYLNDRFMCSRNHYGDQITIDPNTVVRKLIGLGESGKIPDELRQPDSVLLMADLARYLIGFYRSDEEGEDARDLLDYMFNTFPKSFGLTLEARAKFLAQSSFDAFLNETLLLVLEIRTQFLLQWMSKNSRITAFDPNEMLQATFYESDGRLRGPDYWDERFILPPSMETSFTERITAIRKHFSNDINKSLDTLRQEFTYTRFLVPLTQWSLRMAAQLENVIAMSGGINEIQVWIQEEFEKRQCAEAYTPRATTRPALVQWQGEIQGPHKGRQSNGVATANNQQGLRNLPGPQNSSQVATSKPTGRKAQVRPPGRAGLQRGQRPKGTATSGNGRTYDIEPSQDDEAPFLPLVSQRGPTSLQTSENVGRSRHKKPAPNNAQISGGTSRKRDSPIGGQEEEAVPCSSNRRSHRQQRKRQRQRQREEVGEEEQSDGDSSAYSPPRGRRANPKGREHHKTLATTRARRAAQNPRDFGEAPPPIESPIFGIGMGEDDERGPPESKVTLVAQPGPSILRTSVRLAAQKHEATVDKQIGEVAITVNGHSWQAKSSRRRKAPDANEENEGDNSDAQRISSKLTFRCDGPNCQKVFTRVKDLTQHKRSHTGEKIFPCDKPNCESSFGRKEHLKRHKRSHEGLKSFRCDWPGCGKWLTRKSTDHKRLHTGEKKFRCARPNCGQRFTQSTHLASHERTHIGEKNFHCSECGKSFTHRSNFKSHQGCRSRQKNFHCLWPDCGKSYTERGSLNRHRTAKHGEKEKLSSRADAKRHKALPSWQVSKGTRKQKYVGRQDPYST